jgi:NADPH-dependent ferric siderophore reductase
MSKPNRPPRPVRTVTVVRSEPLGRDMVRVVLAGEDLRELPEMPLTDHYVKLKFGDVTRTYTVRWFDRDAAEMAIDFVIHGDHGLAGPWAARAVAGDELSFVGPGGGWAPSAEADVHLLVGDESAIPAIAAALDALPDDAAAQVYIEVASADHRQPLRETSATHITWVYRNDHSTEDGRPLGYGEALTLTVMRAPVPSGRIEAFVHGNADMVKPLRKYLFKHVGIPRDQVSISGYWRSGMNEDGWQSSKAEFNAAMEADD